MSASIRIQSGISAGTSFWIDRSVLRIGSDPQCEICLPSAELSPHAATVEFRAGKYRVYNRGSAPIIVGVTSLSSGAHDIWEENVIVQLPGNLRLVLEMDGDPQPCPRHESRRIDDFAEQEHVSATDTGSPTAVATPPKKASNTLVQLAVIAVCVVGMVTFLTMGGGQETTSPQQPSFEEIVDKLLAAGNSARPLLQRLQYAQAALVRGHNLQAKQRFLDLRDRLIRQTQAKPLGDQHHAQLALEYVEFRLSQLQ